MFARHTVTCDAAFLHTESLADYQIMVNRQHHPETHSAMALVLVVPGFYPLVFN